MEIKEKTTLVTGGASGLGKATLISLAAKGARTILADLPSENSKMAAEEIGAYFISMDVTSTEDIEEGLKHIKQKIGNIDICVNCAGIAPAAMTLGKSGPHDFDVYSKTIEVNLAGMFNVVRLASSQMASNKPNDDGERGVIINTSSIASTDGQRGQVAYASSKAGVAGMTLPLARDLGRFGIRVVSICPGIFDTPMLKTVKEDVRQQLAENVVFPKRLGQPKEFAQLVNFLIECPYVNGENIRLDGGLRMV
ncbi:MAG: SDR family NAD(P)-dependent oxidoreductase [Rhodobacteraceae bacterium]|nr:SDR family NAD(P)-dependent oxidoreductase [Paracoccaceae bacterium]MCY4251499.1 SDR family NAD(P)-dependent oxidoreductase [Paracoccaceae bacterium]MCY4308442.1 SDR family NAD(P)-dependent oxidoreductase [Paracoccaceae bacterium]